MVNEGFMIIDSCFNPYLRFIGYLIGFAIALLFPVGLLIFLVVAYLIGALFFTPKEILTGKGVFYCFKLGEPSH